MKGFIAAGVAASVAIVGMFFWMTGGSKPQMSAYAELIEAVKNSKTAEWLHVRTDMKASGGQVEMWGSLTPSRAATRMGDQLTYQDGSTHKQYVYDPKAGTITVDDMPDTSIIHSKGFDSFEAVTSKFDEMVKGSVAVTKEKKVVDGKTYQVYTIHMDMMTMMTAIDPASKRIAWTEMSTDKGTMMHMTYDYPAAGPEDIYALGAPRNAAIIQGSIAEVKALYDKIEAARSAFAPRYFAVISGFNMAWIPGSTPMMFGTTIIYRKASHYRIEVYSMTAGEAKKQSLPDDMDGILAWVKDRHMTSIFFGDSSLEADIAAMKPGATVFSLDSDGRIEKKTPSMMMWQMCTVESKTWLPRMFMPSQPGVGLLPARAGQYGDLEGIGQYHSSASVPGIKMEMPAGMMAMYYNPARDYVAEQMVTVQFTKDVGQAGATAVMAAVDSTGPDVSSAEVMKVTEYGQTDQGQWYAKTIAATDSSGKAGGPNMTTRIFLDTTRDIPDDLFDMAKFEEEHKAPAK